MQCCSGLKQLQSSQKVVETEEIYWGCFPHKKQRPAGDDTCGSLFYGGCSAAVFSRLMSVPFSCMSQFSCSSVMPGILFFTSSRFIRRGSFLSIKPRFCDAVLRLRPVVGRVRTARCVAPSGGIEPPASGLIARLEAALYKNSISAICKPTLLPTIEKLACDGDRCSSRMS